MHIRPGRTDGTDGGIAVANSCSTHAPSSRATPHTVKTAGSGTTARRMVSTSAGWLGVTHAQTRNQAPCSQEKYQASGGMRCGACKRRHLIVRDGWRTGPCTLRFHMLPARNVARQLLNSHPRFPCPRKNRIYCEILLSCVPVSLNFCACPALSQPVRNKSARHRAGTDPSSKAAVTCESAPLTFHHAVRSRRFQHRTPLSRHFLSKAHK